jgi:serine/threonine protein kinase
MLSAGDYPTDGGGHPRERGPAYHRGKGAKTLPMSPSPPDDEVTGFDPTMSFPPAPPVPRPTLETGNALPPGTYLGEFELLSVVGEGGFGIVYRAWDHSLKRQVAVKEYMPSSLAQRTGGMQVSVRSDKYSETFLAGLQSFVKEARMLAQFDHPALVKVFRFWEANGSAYMVMPFYEGTTLRDELRLRQSPPDEATLLGWIGPIADALAIIHAEYWYHRDIAPDNVLLLAGSRRPVLLDFGAARRVIGDMTQALTVILKPGYAPVEQYAEIPGMKQGPWTDVYALAAMAYYAVRGKTPPPSVGRLVNDSFEPLSKVVAGRYSERVLKAIDHALAVRPENRTPNISAFKAELGLAPPPASADDLDPSARSTVPGALDFDLPPAPEPAPAAEERTRVVPSPTRADVPERTRVVAAEAGPQTMRVPPPGAAPQAAPASAPGAAAAETGSRRGLLIAGAAALAAVAGGGLWWSGRTTGQAPGPAPVASTPAPAPAQAPAAAPPPVAAAGFDPVGAFERIVASQTPGWGLEVTAAKTKLKMDRDKLVFSLRSLQDGLVYVFNFGSDGALQQLYPNEMTPALRVSKGRALTLPQGPLEFSVTGPPGPGHVLVIVSRYPREMTAFAPRVENGFTSFPTGSVAAALEGANAGRLPLLAGMPQCPAGTACADEFGAALLAIEVTP